jgi:hypothetical protein
MIKIEDLRIGQKVFFNNIERTICKLDSTDGGIIYFSDNGFIKEDVIFRSFIYSVELNAGSFSLTPPKQKKRYWIWAIKNPKYTNIYMSNTFLDEDGITVNKINLIEKEWLFKKFENFFIDVEE